MGWLICPSRPEPFRLTGSLCQDRALLRHAPVSYRTALSPPLPQVLWNVSLRVRSSWEQRKCSCKVTGLGRKGGSKAPRLNTKESSLCVRRAHDERLLRSRLGWSGKAPARLSAKNCCCPALRRSKTVLHFQAPIVRLGSDWQTNAKGSLAGACRGRSQSCHPRPVVSWRPALLKRSPRLITTFYQLRNLDNQSQLA